MISLLVGCGVGMNLRPLDKICMVGLSMGMSESSGAASSISEGDIFIYSCSGQLSSFEIKSISKELICPEHEYMNTSPSLIELMATPLLERFITLFFQCFVWISEKIRLLFLNW